MRSLAAALLLAFAAALPASASAVAWTGGGDGVNWSDPLNWSPVGVPGAGADVVVASGAVTASAGVLVSAASLDLGAPPSTATLRLTTGTVVSGQLRVRAGSILIFDSTQPAQAGTFLVETGGLVTAIGPLSQSTVAVTVSAGLFDLQAGATLTVAGL
ncbi:MAG: hypothetical protein KGL53_07060, partial [Elusimicrobia bacterium]|nr:hypothetical protein [Elusimicrobiota bacterium]